MQSKRIEYLQKLIDKKNNPYIKIITGIRRCGKSYLLKKIYYNYLIKNGIKKDQIIIIELDDDKYEDLRDKKALRKYIEDKASDKKIQYYIMIDEVQILEDFEGTIISINNHDNYDVYITGSNSKFLSHDISTKFKDRGVEIRVHPLSYREFYDSYEGDKHFALVDYMTFGGMPYLLNEKEEKEKINYLINLVKNTYLTDVIERNDVRLPLEIESLFDTLCSSTGSLVSPTKLSNYLKSNNKSKTNSETVFKYIKFMQEAFMINIAKRYDIKGKAYLSTPFKCYVEDVGLRNARINFRQNDIGFTIENIVYNELISREFLVDVGMLTQRNKNNDGKYSYKQEEVDFIARLASKAYYIQVMSKIPIGQHKLNEYNVLNKIDNSFKKVIIVNDMFKAFYDEYGILNISLEEFLLNKDSLDI